MSKLKKIILLVAILLATCIIGISIYKHLTEKEKIEDNSGQGSIGVEDVIYLAVDSGDPNDDINNVKMYTNAFKTHLVASFNGCGDYHCKYNLQTEGLSSGNYYVVVTTETSYTFNGFIYYNP